MSITQQNGVCPALLTGVEALLGTNPSRLITPVGGIQSTLDPENKRGITIEQLGEGDQGHRKTVRVSWKQRQTPDDVRDAKSCDSGEEKPVFEDTFDVALHSEIAIQVKEATIRKMCDVHSALQKIPVSQRDSDGKAKDYMLVLADIAEEVLMDLDALRQKMNENFLTAVALNIGAWKGGASSKTFNVIKDADNAIVLTGFNKMKQELKRIAMMGRPIIFGGGNIDLAFEAIDLGCCNSAGQDFGKMSPKAGYQYYFDDADMNSFFGDANAFIAFYSKAIQTCVFNKYVGSFARQIGTMERGTLPDPAMPGLRYDIRTMPNECGEYWDLWVNVDYDFWFAPNTLFKSSDRLTGVNGIFKGIAAGI